jgi:hypothetical protein
LISALERDVSRVSVLLRRLMRRDAVPSIHAVDAPFDRTDIALTAHDCLSLLDIMVVCANGMRGSHPSKRASDDDIVEFHRAAGRLRQLAQLLLADPRPEALRRQVIDVNQVIAESERMLARVLPPGLSLRLALADMPAMVRADRWDIERILLNLVLNGSRGLEDGSVVVIGTASKKQVPPGLRSPHIRVRSYITLTVNEASVPFHRGSRVVAHFRNVERLGSDLSLTTVARSVQQLEGALQVEIDSDRHIRIRVDLPLVSDS